MAEEVTESGGGLREGLREGASDLREDVRRDKLEGRLEEKMAERPVLRHLLDMRVVIRALIAAVLVCLFFVVIGHAKFGAFLLVVVFLATWLIGAARQYDKRRPTEPVDAEEEEE